MSHIRFRDFDTTPAKYVEFLRETYRAARATLRQPEEQWPAGSSHEISRAIMAEAQEKAMDTALEFGLYDAYGKLTGYSEP